MMPQAKQQGGMVLLVSLLLLLMITLLALSAANRSTLQERMAANSQDANRNFQAAQSGVSAAYSRIDGIQPGNSSAWKSAVGNYSRYCANIEIKKEPVTLTRFTESQGNALGVGKTSVKYYAAEVTVNGAQSDDINCANPLAVHVSGYLIPRLN